jgi:hypothetical protein
MKQSKIDLLNAKVDLMLEKTSSSDVGQFPELIKPLLYKVYTESLVSEIADIQQLTSPVGKVYTLFSNYGGRDTDDLNSENSSVIVVSNATGLLVDGAITSATGTGVIVYVEGTNLLVRVSSGYFQKSQVINGGAVTITDAISNRNYTRKVFKNYSGPFITDIGEDVVIKNIDHEIKDSTVTVKTRKLKSKISKEVLQDIKAVFGKDISDGILENEFGSEMVQSIDMEVIDYLRTIATPISDLVLSNSYGTQNDLTGVAADIYANVYKLTTDIMRDTKRRKNFFVLADAATMGLLMTSPLHVKPEENLVNSYSMGKIGGSYNLYLDPYATEHYVLVGYKNGNDDELGDAGLIFAPYTNSIWSTFEPESGKSIFFNMVRYGFTTHPQDTTTGTADSIFFKTFKVNMSNLTNYTNIV